MNKFNEKDFKSMIDEEHEFAKKAFDALAIQPIYYDVNEPVDPDNDSRLRVKNHLVLTKSIRIKKGDTITTNHNHEKNTTILTVAKEDFDLKTERRFYVRGFIQMGILQIERVWYCEDIAEECREFIEVVMR